jgi:DNA repair exonuclease SbcCD nuclease subunit
VVHQSADLPKHAEIEALKHACMLTFLHSADWQIGKPYARVQDPDKRARLRQARIEAIGRIGALIPRCKASFLVVAGDLFDSPTPSSSDVSAVCQAIGKLQIPVLAIPGNHDHGAPGSVWHSAFFLAEQQRRAPNLMLLLERQVLELDTAVVLPCPLLRRSDTSDPTAWVRQLQWAALPPDKPRILLAHGSVHGFEATDFDADDDQQASSNNRLQLDASLLEQLDYVALGDWHGLKQINPRTWYSGTPEPDRFPRTDHYQGGQVLAVSVQRGAPALVEPHPTATLEWRQLHVRLQGPGHLERLEQQLEPLLQGEPGQHLLLLEQSGSLNLEGHRRYEQLLERLEAQLLRLKRRGVIEQSPDPSELEALIYRADDPLIARVAAGLQAELQQAEHTADPHQRQLLQLALAELHRAAGAATCA